MQDSVNKNGNGAVICPDNLKFIHMKKIISIIAVTIFIGALASPVMASGREKPKKAKTEQTTEKKASDKATSEKDCSTSCCGDKKAAEVK
jgi:hypothetical protein